MDKCIEEKIVSIFIKAFMDKRNQVKVDCNSDIIKMGINSISFIKIIVDIENEFDIEFDDEKMDINVFKNIKEISDYIRTLL